MTLERRDRDGCRVLGDTDGVEDGARLDAAPPRDPDTDVAARNRNLEISDRDRVRVELSGPRDDEGRPVAAGRRWHVSATCVDAAAPGASAGAATLAPASATEVARVARDGGRRCLRAGFAGGERGGAAAAAGDDQREESAEGGSESVH